MGSLCCCNSNGLIKSPRAKSDQKQSLLNDDNKVKDEYESDEDQPQSSYLKDDGDNSSDASMNDDEEKETAPDIQEKTYKQWMELIFWQFAGSSAHSKKKLYMNIAELDSFLSIVNLDNNDEDGDNLVITSDKVLIILEKNNHQQPLIACSEFCEFFCDSMVNPKCNEIQRFIEKQSNWILLQNALKVFDVVDVDKVKIYIMIYFIFL